MPVDALPVAWGAGGPDTVTYRREYRDLLGRPMRGQVTVTGTTRWSSDQAVTLPAPVVVELVGGVLEVDLPPDTYSLVAALRTVDGERANDSDEVILSTD